MGRACGIYGGEGNAYGALVGNSEGKRPSGGPGWRWEGNIQMNLKEIGWDGMDWIHLAQDRNKWWAVVSMVRNLQVLYDAGNF
jgi:hypothetical protein